MSRSIRITVGDLVLSAELNDSRTAQKVWEALPLTGEFHVWGDEIYLSIPVEAGPEDPKSVVEIGDLAYWPPGHAFCIFFGPTPASRGDEIRAASAVNVIGKVLSDPKVFRKTQDGVAITLEKA